MDQLTDNQLLHFLFPHLAAIGSGGFLGFAIGYSMKKMLKFTILLIGGLAAIVFALQYFGFLTLNMDKAVATYDSFIPFVIAKLKLFFNHIIFNLPTTAVGFVAGLVIGLKKG